MLGGDPKIYLLAFFERYYETEWRITRARSCRMQHAMFAYMRASF